MSKNSAFLLTCLIAGLLFLPIQFASSEEAAGKKIFLDAKCNTCHAVSTEGIEKKSSSKSEKKGPPDLSGVGKKHTADWFSKYLQKQEALNEKKHLKAFTGKSEDLATLAKWLESLKTEKKQ